MAKKKSFDEFTVRRNVQLEAEIEQERAAVAARDKVIEELMAKAKAAPPAVSPAPATPPPNPIDTLRAEYNILKANQPYHAAEFLLNHPEIAHSKFGGE